VSALPPLVAHVFSTNSLSHPLFLVDPQGNRVLWLHRPEAESAPAPTPNGGPEIEKTRKGNDFDCLTKYASHPMPFLNSHECSVERNCKVDDLAVVAHIVSAPLVTI
jgi:hypothetical protein